MRLRSIQVVPIFLLAGCAGGGGELQPARSANVVIGMSDTATVNASSVQLILQADEWPEGREVPARVTPVLVDIVNRGDAPLRLEYRHFVLQTWAGRKLAAIPPFRVYGTPLSPQVEPARARIELSYDAKGFEVAPHYASLYEGVAPYGRPFAADQRYHGTHYAYWERAGADLPTRDMKVLALPEGVLRPGGQITGYLYFEKVPADADRVQFHLNLVHADTGDVFDVATVPFVVSR
jgi:hypothetical protein